MAPVTSLGRFREIAFVTAYLYYFQPFVPRESKVLHSTTTPVLLKMRLPAHWFVAAVSITCIERVGGRAGTAASQGVVCSYPARQFSANPRNRTACQWQA